jgi:hypothetical protein
MRTGIVAIFEAVGIEQVRFNLGCLICPGQKIMGSR